MAFPDLPIVMKRLRLLLTAAILSSCPWSAFAQEAPTQSAATVESPSATPAVRAARAWLETARTANDDEFLRFVSAHWPDSPVPPDQLPAIKRTFRNLEPREIVSATATEAELLVWDPSRDSFALLSMKLRTDDPERVASLQVQPTDRIPAGASPQPKLQDPELIGALRARLEQGEEPDRFSGAILIARDGRVLFQQAYGLADREAQKANSLDTQFRFGSMGKMFTAVAIMQLVEAGKIALDVPIGRYLPNYPNQEIATKVTIAHLLTHTGGTGDIFGPQFDAEKDKLRDLADYVALYGERAPQFPPATRSAYSNYGFILLGRIVEQVSGLSYDDYIQRHIFAPADMHSTGNLAESVALPKRAISYTGFPLKPAPLPLRGTSAGGGYSTVGDFKKFTDALLSNRLLRADTFKTLSTGGVKLPDGGLRQYDFGGTRPGLGRYVGHGGGAPGMNGDMFHYLDKGYTIIILANRDPPMAESVLNFITHRLP